MPRLGGAPEGGASRRWGRLGGTAAEPSDLFSRDAHAEAVARIGFCVTESALGVLVGDVGSGKTVAVRAAVAGLDPTRHHIIYIANPAFGTRGLYVSIVTALGAAPRFHKAEVMAQAAGLLAAEESERHRRVVIVVDEAHLLTPAQLEELRLLTNADVESMSASWSGSRCSPVSCAWASSPLSTSASPLASR
jgi:type II secretory pathway predicted ATPase ExeA